MNRLFVVSYTQQKNYESDNAMVYEKVVKGKFISRPNRFIGNVDIEGSAETVHIKNTGRCKELLIPGAEVYLAKSGNPQRKTQYDLIGVKKELSDGTCSLYNIDSMAANDTAAEWLPKSGLFGKDAVIRREVFCGASRFDFMIDDGGETTWLEVKGVTLVTDGIARFPDAPTERGVKHLRELTSLALEGHRTAVLFVIQTEAAKAFAPNDETHRAFGDALREASRAGVDVMARRCHVTEDSVEITDAVEIIGII